MSYRKSKQFKLGLTTGTNQSLSNYVLFTSHAQKQQGNINIKDIVFQLHQMGFEDDRVEKALLYGEVKSIEEIMYFLVPNKDGLWEHKFVPEDYCKTQDLCLFCKRHKKKIVSNSNKSSDKSMSQIGEQKSNNDVEKNQMTSK